MVLMEDNIRPIFSIAEAQTILDEYYTIQADTITELSAELDRNFYVQAADGSEYILKVAHASLSPQILDLQNSALKHLAQTLDIFPKIILSKNHDDTCVIASQSGDSYTVRVLNYLQGMPLVDFRPNTDALLADIGHQLGKLSDAMQTFTHTEQRLDYRWNVLNFLDVMHYMDGMADDKQAIIHHFVELYSEVVAPKLDSLRHSFIYNDANDHNILVQAQSLEDYRVSGMIDFGDMVYSPTIMELAVNLAYVMMNKQHPLHSAKQVIQSYHKQFPLTEDEIFVLFPLVCARLCMSVCISWYQQKQEPDNAHLSISETDAWDLLHTLHSVHPNYAYYMFRSACNIPPCPQTQPIIDYLSAQKFHPILNYQLTPENTDILDLTIGSTELGNVDDFADTPYITARIFERLGNNIGIGRYNEARPIYLGDMFDIDHHERRAVHIGLDLFTYAQTPIYAPLAGTVYSVQENVGDKDYGPTLILKHQPMPDITFYTLYGHLDASVLDMWDEGDAISAGDKIALIGDFPRNGNWTPHVHFQVITDMLNNHGEFAGVTGTRYRDVWLSLSPNPNLILKIPQQTEPDNASNHEQIIEARKKHLNPSMSISYHDPIKIERGYMHHLYDENGHAYLDCVNNVPHVGHSNPRVVKAGQRQMAVLNTNTRYLHDTIVEFSERLCAKLPDPLSVCFFVNSGSEANELAIRLARTYTGTTDFIVTDHAYHGNTSALIDLSPYKFNGLGGMGKPDHVQIATIPDGYRGEKRGFSSEVGRYYAQSVQGAINNITENGRRVAGFFSEGILGTGGQLPLPDDYLKTAYAMVRNAGGLCIADEVQVGLGRVGRHFWAFELQDVSPDIVTIGKPLGNGHPLAAVITTREIADAFNNGMEYFNTFAGNPVSCAIGLEVLNIIEDNNLQQNALEVGNYWMDCLRQLQPQYPIIGHVRGSGLFMGIELIRDTDNLEPAPEETRYIIERMKKRGFLLSSEGYLHNVIKIKPPIIFTKAHVDLFMSEFETVLKDTVLQ